MDIYNLGNSIAYMEAQGLSKVFQAYADNCPGEDIMEVGCNSGHGNIYIALENGISIVSTFGNDPFYIYYDSENEEEIEFDTYDEVMDYIEN